MWKPRIKYYLTNNPIGFFLVVLNLGLLISSLNIIPVDSVDTNITNSPKFIFYVVSIFLNLPVFIFAAVILIPFGLLFGIEVYLVLGFFTSIFLAIYYWFFIGKKITNYFKKDDDSNYLKLN